MSRLVFKISAIIMLMISILGCTGSIKNINPYDVKTYDRKFEMADLYKVANKMAQSIITSDAINFNDYKDKPVISFLGIRNKTDEHFNFEDIPDVIQTSLLKTGKFRIENAVFSNDIDDRIIEEKNRASSGLLNKKAAEQWEKGEGAVHADFYITGTVTADYKKTSTKRISIYRLTFELTNRNREIIWKDDMRIGKSKGRNIFFD